MLWNKTKSALFVLIAVSVSAVFLNFKAEQKNNPANDPVIQLYFDSIPAGAITLKELMGVKILRVTSSGQNCKVKSFVLNYLPTTGASAFGKIVGNSIKTHLQLFAKAGAGDHILISNLVIEGMPKYKLESPKGLMWTIVKTKI